jgi:hypothetical protein
MLWEQAVVDRYQQQQAGETKPYAMELHVIRLGDVAIATNSFELFADYGIQMKARSKALQTFVIQLAGPGTYLPTETPSGAEATQLWKAASSVPRAAGCSPNEPSKQSTRCGQVSNRFWP